MEVSFIAHLLQQTVEWKNLKLRGRIEMILQENLPVIAHNFSNVHVHCNSLSLSTTPPSSPL